MVAEQQQQEEIYYGAIEIDERTSHSTDSSRSSENRNRLFGKNEPAVSPNWISCENTRGGKERGRTGREGKREGGTDLRRLVVSVIELEMSVNPEWKYH